MNPDALARPDDRRLTPARARLGALLPHLSELEALLGIAEVFVQRPAVRAATGTPAPPVRVAASDVPAPVVASAPPGATTLSPAGERPTYTVAEAAALLGLSEHALRERIRVGGVPVLRLGRRVLVRSATVERLLAEGEARPRR
jgi:excisionase family DNA binding protein